MRKIVFIIRDLNYGGAQRQLVTLACGLDRREFDVTVVHFYSGPLEGTLRHAGVRSVCVRKTRRWNLIGFFVRLAGCIRGLQPDLLHGYLTESNLMTVLLKPFCPRARIVWGVRDSQTDAPLWGVLAGWSFRLARLLSRFADRIIANSRSGRDYYAGLGYPAGRIAVIPNGIDTDRFRPDPAARESARHELGAAPEDFLFGIAGRLNPMKDHATFLRAAARAAAAVPAARFICLGDGPPAYVAGLRRLAGSLGVEPRVIWRSSRHDMEAFYNALDVLVSSSAFGEGFSNVIGEAMACGTSCVATDVGDARWIMGDAGFAVPVGDDDALAKAMVRVAQLPPAELLRLKQRARNRMVDQFTVAQLVARTRELLLDLCPEGAAAGCPRMEPFPA